MAFDQEKATQELAKTLNDIDFAGGLEEGPSTPASTEQKATEEKPSTPAAEETATEEQQGSASTEQKSSEESAEGDTSTSSESEGTKADDAKAIPDSHYRAALHMGYTPEEIGSLYDANPDLALKTLAKAYESVNAVSKQLGELGQRARQMQAEPAPPTAPQPSRKDALLKQLKEKYEDDPIIDILGELIPDQAPAHQPVRRQQEPPASRPSVDQEIAARQQINTFFTADEMGVYSDFYGQTSQAGTWDMLTPGQRANRIEVCNRAQNILDGATLAGMQLSVTEALERAHLEVAAPMAEQVVRERIVKSVQKRAAGVTLKPSGSKALPPSSGQYNKEQAVKEMKGEFAKVFE